MAKIRDPLVFSSHFKIDPSVLEAAGAVDPTLNVDLKLFIDPLLLGQSRVEPIRKNAPKRIHDYFEQILVLLTASKQENDLPARQTKRLLSFPEVSATCLGYGAASIRGSGMGAGVTSQILKTAKEIVDLGIQDPKLFLLLPLFEEKIGADLISDMVTHIILPDLVTFTLETLSGQPIPLFDFFIDNQKWTLPRNPCSSKEEPVLLVPMDVLAELPIATSRDDIDRVVAHNQRLRDQFNQHLGGIWHGQILSRKKKEEMRAFALSSKESFNTLLELVTNVPRKPYSLDKDPKRLILWREIHKTIAGEFPLAIERPSAVDAQAVSVIAKRIIDHFTILIERHGLWDLLWYAGKPCHENVVQMIFFAMADAYCKANDLGIIPEFNTRTGEIDFVASNGYTGRVLVEVKLSRNSKLTEGYEKQLEIYKTDEKEKHGFYVILDLGDIGIKDVQIIGMQKTLLEAGKLAPEICFIDAHKRESETNAFSPGSHVDGMMEAHSRSRRRLPKNSLRKLLTEILHTDSDLDAFTLDFFPDTKRLFSDGMNTEQKRNLLLEKEDPEAILAHLRERLEA